MYILSIVVCLMLLCGCETKTSIDGELGSTAVVTTLSASDRQSLEAQNPRVLRKIDYGEPLDVQDIKDMSKAGIRDDVIVCQIRATHSQFHLTTADVVDLKNSGVSQKVIRAMIKSG